MILNPQVINNNFTFRETGRLINTAVFYAKFEALFNAPRQLQSKFAAVFNANQTAAKCCGG